LQHHKLSHLRHVKLSQPPKVSNFWRYHDKGQGKVSTIEALVLLLYEFRTLRAASEAPSEAPAAAPLDRISAPVESLPEAKLLLLFGLIREAIIMSNSKRGEETAILPMDEEAKEARRLQRRQRGTLRQQSQKVSYIYICPYMSHCLCEIRVNFE
jgi:hypothetical protein